MNTDPDTLRGIVYNLRNSVAHFGFTPVHQSSVVTGFTFTANGGFEATIDISEMREFVEKLAEYLKQKAEE